MNAQISCCTLYCFCLSCLQYIYELVSILNDALQSSVPVEFSTSSAPKYNGYNHRTLVYGHCTVLCVGSLV